MVISIFVFHPLIAIFPSLISRPTAILSPNFSQAFLRKPFSVKADVPIITLSTPIDKYFSIVSIFLIPPPTWNLHSSCLTISLIILKFFVLPSSAPSRSTRCIKLAPSLIHFVDTSKGLSE